MATSTERAGWQEVDSALPPPLRARAYVPPRCVGTRRCPLLVILGAYPPEALADRYGMIFLGIIEYTTDDFLSGIWEGKAGFDPAVPYLARELPHTRAASTSQLDTLLKQTLHAFAIDPEKIGLTGNSSFGTYTYYWGVSNPDVFSRVALTSTSGFLDGGTLPDNAAQQFYLADGILEDGAPRSAFEAGARLRRAGFPVKQVLQLQAHVAYDYYMYDAMLRWLQESWSPTGAVPLPRVGPGSLAALTPGALARMQQFWLRFGQEPDSIRHTARMTSRREILFPVGRQWLSVWLDDMPALAARYPSVNAALQAAGLTAAQEQAYHVALLNASRIADWRRDMARFGPMPYECCLEPIDAGSVSDRNAILYEAHRSEIQYPGTGDTWWSRMPLSGTPFP